MSDRHVDPIEQRRARDATLERTQPIR